MLRNANGRVREIDDRDPNFDGWRPGRDYDDELQKKKKTKYYVLFIE